MNDQPAPILVCYDGSEPARRAVRDAAALFGASRRAVVVTVWEPALDMEVFALSDYQTAPAALDPETVHELDDELEARARRIAESGAELAASLGLPAEGVAAHDEGRVARTIVDVARDRQASLIVVGSRGLTGLRARLEGSTSTAVVKHAPCPVLVCHHDD